MNIRQLNALILLADGNLRNIASIAKNCTDCFIEIAGSQKECAIGKNILNVLLGECSSLKSFSWDCALGDFEYWEFNLCHLPPSLVNLTITADCFTIAANLFTQLPHLEELIIGPAKINGIIDHLPNSVRVVKLYSNFQFAPNLFEGLNSPSELRIHNALVSENATIIKLPISLEVLSIFSHVTLDYSSLNELNRLKYLHIYPVK
ncbi:MAG: hypothetical protein LBI69_00655 [Puniceicoccales bacterium]|nr:hypothetical protein [Puniceicoccales bacterium]